MVFVHLLPGLIPEDGLRGGVVVVIDVLRATTMIVHALVAGCTEVIPVSEVEEARQIAAALPVGSALLAGERQGVPIDGFDLGNSPGECTPARCRGKIMVITTTNGTRALLACRDAERVFLGAFVNFAATCRRLLMESKPIHLVCAGTDGRISYEDTLAAGAFAKQLRDQGRALGNDEAEIAAGLWTSVQGSLGFRAGQNDPVSNAGSLAGYLTRGRGGQRVVELGRGDDIAAAAWFNQPDHQIVAEFQREPPRILAEFGQGEGQGGECSGRV
jgi:2-phosphosulfolactate phosphatase